MDNERTINIIFTEDELWNAYICLYNLTTKPRENFYEPATKKSMIEIRDKLYDLGETIFEWVK